MACSKRIPQDVDDCIIRSSNPLVPAFLCAFIFFATILAIFLWPDKAAQPEKLPDPAAFQQLFQKITVYDQKIAALEHSLVAVDLSDPKRIQPYYEQLTTLQVLKQNRATLAMNYNGMARNLSTHRGISPMELKKFGLSTGIR